jgi:hypothetical protein
MQSVTATFHNGRLELTQPVDWPDGTQVEVTPIGASVGGDQDVRKVRRETYRELIRRLAGCFGNEPFERPPQGAFEVREEW